MTRDLINGTLEIGGALITLLSVRQILRDRVMRGFHWGPTVFFTGWGIWNLYFYSSLSLPLSLLGSVLLVLVNCCYLFLMLSFWRGNRRGSPEYIITWHPGVYDDRARERLRTEIERTTRDSIRSGRLRVR